jgi:hypothetical protein
MTESLFKVGIVILLIGLFLVLVFSNIVSAGIPVMNGKMLVYAWVDQNGNVLPIYTTFLYMYNDTTVIVTGIVHRGYESGDKVFSYILMYDSSTNTLSVKGTTLREDLEGGIISRNEFQKWGFWYILNWYVVYGILPILPKSFIDNLNHIASMGSLNYVETCYDERDNNISTEQFILNINTTLIHIGMGEYNGYQVVIVKLYMPENVSTWSVKEYWGMDGVLLYARFNPVLLFGSQQGEVPAGIKLIAQDDLGLKKTAQKPQPSTTTTTTLEQTQSPTTITEITHIPTTTQKPGNISTISSPITSSTSQASNINPLTTSPGTSSFPLKQQTQASPTRTGTQWNMIIAAGIAITVIALVITMILLRKH